MERDGYGEGVGTEGLLINSEECKGGWGLSHLENIFSS